MENDFQRAFRIMQQDGGSISFAHSLEKDTVFMSYFEAQFNNAPLKPDVKKYWLKFYTENELNKGFEEARSKIPKSQVSKGYVMASVILLTEFERDLDKKKSEFLMMPESQIPEDCFIHDITKTPIYISLKEIDEIIERFRKNIDHDKSILMKQAEHVAKAIVSEVNKIDNYPSIQEQILGFIINDNDNFHLDIELFIGNEENSEKRDNWKNLKMYLNNFLSEVVSLKAKSLSQLNTETKTNNHHYKLKSFDLGLSDEQLTNLHKALIDEKYLKCDSIDFINAFKGNPIQEKIEWIDISQRNKSINMQTLFLLLASLGIELANDRNVITKSIKDFIKSVFKNDFGNMTSKYTGCFELNTDRKKTISSIVKETLNLN